MFISNVFHENIFKISTNVEYTAGVSDRKKDLAILHIDNIYVYMIWLNFCLFLFAEPLNIATSSLMS